MAARTTAGVVVTESTAAVVGAVREVAAVADRELDPTAEESANNLDYTSTKSDQNFGSTPNTRTRACTSDRPNWPARQARTP